MKSIFPSVVMTLLMCFSSLAMAGPDTKGWKTYRTDHFIVYSTQSEKSVRDLLYEFEIFRATVYESLQLNSDKQLVPVEIYLMDNPSDFAYFSRQGVAGYFDDTIYGPKMVVGPAATSGLSKNAVLYHEYLHYLTRATTAFRYPAWYSEGLAEYYSTLEIHDDFVVVGRGTKRNVSPKSIDKVMSRKSTREIKSQRKLAEFYASSWLLVNFFNLSAVNGFPSYRDSLTAYLQAFNRGADNEAAFAAAFEIDSEELYRQLKDYLRKRQLNLARLPLPEVNLEIEMRPISEGAIALEFAYLANIWSETGQELLAKAIELNNADAFAQKAYGLTVEKSSDAQQWLDKAISSAGLGIDGLVNIANIYSMLANRSPADKQALLEESKSYLDQAQLLDNSAVVHYFYPNILWELGLKQEAINQVEASIHAMPANIRVNLQAGKYMHKINNIPNTRYFLTNVVNWSKSSKAAARAQAILDQLPAR